MKKSEWFSCRCITLLYLVLCIFCLNFPPALSESTYHIKLSESAIELAKGKSIRILAEVDGLKTKFSWSSENPLIAAVSTTGTVTAKGNGTTTITCAASINEKEIRESVVINVYTPVQGIKLPQSISIDAGKSTEPLTITFSPADASNQQVKWTSDNTSVVTIEMKAQDGQGAEQTAKIWCFDSKKTVTEKNIVFKNTTSALNKLKDSVTSMKTLSDMVSKKSDVKDTADKTFASFMSAIGVTYLYSQFANRNKEETSMSCSAKKPSYCFIGGKQIWCFFAKDNSSNYEGYGYIKVPEGQLYLTHITLSAIFADNYLNERFDDEFVSYEVPGDILMAELRATANRLK